MTYKVILADGSPSVRKAVELAFPESEFELFHFDNGQELIRALPDIVPDALLVSLSLPGLDGYSAAAHLRSLKELGRASIFFLRGSFDTFDADKAAGLEYEEVMRKPFDSEALARRLKSVLDRNHDLWSFPDASEIAVSPEPAGRAESPELAALVRMEVDKACIAMEGRLRDSLLSPAPAPRPDGGKSGGEGRRRKP